MQAAEASLLPGSEGRRTSPLPSAPRLNLDVFHSPAPPPAVSAAVSHPTTTMPAPAPAGVAGAVGGTGVAAAQAPVGTLVRARCLSGLVEGTGEGGGWGEGGGG